MTRLIDWTICDTREEAERVLEAMNKTHREYCVANGYRLNARGGVVSLNRQTGKPHPTHGDNLAWYTMHELAPRADGKYPVLGPRHLYRAKEPVGGGDKRSCEEKAREEIEALKTTGVRAAEVKVDAATMRQWWPDGFEKAYSDDTARLEVKR